MRAELGTSFAKRFMNWPHLLSHYFQANIVSGCQNVDTGGWCENNENVWSQNVWSCLDLFKAVLNDYHSHSIRIMIQETAQQHSSRNWRRVMDYLIKNGASGWIPNHAGNHQREIRNLLSDYLYLGEMQISDLPRFEPVTCLLPTQPHRLHCRHSTKLEYSKPYGTTPTSRNL